jgi:N-glycosidase YbiA
MQHGDTIYFLSTNGTYGFLSNFFKAPFHVNGHVYSTSEAYFQAMKFPDNPEIQDLIRKATTPFAAAKLGRNRQFLLRKDWEHVKEGVMKDALKFKFSSNPVLMERLLHTKGLKIVEKSDKDAYWGTGFSGNGLNRLGVLITEFRDSFTV